MVAKNMRWYGILTIFVVVAISYVDRINVSVLIIDQEFLKHIGLEGGDRARMGLLATAFMVGYGVSAFVLTPFCAVLLGVRRSLIVGLVFWGLISAISPLFNSYGLLLLSRVLLGLAEGPLFSLAGAYIKNHFASNESGKPNSFINMGTGMGLAIGYPFISFMLVSFPWQASFYALGIINLLIGIPLVLAFVHMPKTEPVLDARKMTPTLAWQKIMEIFKGALQTPNLITLTLLTAAVLGYLSGSSSWLSAYLKEVRGFSLAEMGILASLPQYMIVFSMLLGGILIDKIGMRRVPYIFMTASIGVSLAIFYSINVDDKYQAVGGMIAANFCWGLLSPAFTSTVQYHSRPEHTASTCGVVFGIGSLVAGFMPTMMGGAMSAMASVGQGTTASSFFVGFSMLIGTMGVVFVCGLILWWRDRRSQQLPRGVQTLGA